MIVRLDRSGSTSTARYRITAAIAGTLDYDTGPEHVPESTLRASASSLVGRRVTLDHPMLRADGSFERGRVIGRVIAAEVRGAALEVDVEITDPDAIARLDSGDLTEASPGYTATVDTDDDTGARVQSARTYDHLALGGPGWSRCGGACSVSHRIDRTDTRITPMSDDTDTYVCPIRRHREWSQTAWMGTVRAAYEARHGRADASDPSDVTETSTATSCACGTSPCTCRPDDGSTAARESAARVSAWLDAEVQAHGAPPPITAAEARERHRQYSVDAWRRPRA